jgi:hypothetical protein
LFANFFDAREGDKFGQSLRGRIVVVWGLRFGIGQQHRVEYFAQRCGRDILEDSAFGSFE